MTIASCSDRRRGPHRARPSPAWEGGYSQGFHLVVIEESEVPPEASVCAALAHDADYHCQPVSWERFTPVALSRSQVHAVVAVAVPHTPDMDKVFDCLQDSAGTVPTLAVLPNEAEESLLRLASESTDDFIVAPIRSRELQLRLRRLLGARVPDVDAVRERLLAEIGLTQLVGSDAVFLRAIEQLPRFARSDVPVLITGETGTGKELCAQAIHHLGRRREFPFIAVDCAALPDHLLENELFGHVRGAFTDAHRDQRGLIGMADRGTLFLDEIDALSLAAQAKLLRFLQEHSYRPLGSDRFHCADVNIIAASNRDLEEAVGARRFRADLYFRVNVLRLHLPPLRERVGDIALLAAHFLSQLRRTPDPTHKRLTPAALRKLESHQWPGNVRELFNVVQRAFVLSEQDQIAPCHIPLAEPCGPPATAMNTFRAARAGAVAAFERSYVEDLLARHAGNITHAAREAGKDRRAFGRLVKKYRLRLPS